MTRYLATTALVLSATTLALGVARLAAAGQATSAPAGPGKWEIEIHAGGMRVSNGTAGTTALPLPGVTFNTINVLPTRRASSWFFGDGAALLNEVNAILGIPGRMTPLDAVLGSRGTSRANGATFGARVGRRVTRRLGAEFSIDLHRGQIGLTAATRDGVAASVESFRSAWTGFLASRPDVFMSPVVFADSEIDDASGGQVFATGAVTFDLLTRKGVTPYVTAGAGVVSHLGVPAEVFVMGFYMSRFPNGAVFNQEGDLVRIRFSQPNRQAVTMVGGGVKGDITPRIGWRADVRVHVSTQSARVRLDAVPDVFRGFPGAAFATGTNPGLQFSSLSQVTSTLSGQPIEDFATLDGSGREFHTSVSAGVFTRFPWRSDGATRGQTRAALLGVKGGFQVGSWDAQPADEIGGLGLLNGVAGGVFAIAAPDALVAFQAEMLFGTRGASIGESGENGAIRLMYLDLPLLARLRLAGTSRNGVYALAGLTPSFLLSARARFNDQDEDFSSETTSVDAGLTIGAGYAISGLHVEARYTIGFLNILKDTDELTVRNRTLAVLVGVPIR